MRLIKDGSADTFKAEFYTTSARTGTPLSATVTGVTWDTPRYFGVWDDYDVGGSNISEGEISEIKFYNGITELNPATLTAVAYKHMTLPKNYTMSN